MKIISVVGARPNFMKIAPFIKEIKRYNEENGNKVEHLLVHTGQHYDDSMSKAFFEQLDIPEADINLGIGSGTHAEQVGQTMIEFEKVLRKESGDWVVVVGDVNATLACSVTAKKQWIKCCHIEAGLRSGDMTMPEEINRIVTDRVCDLLLTPDKMAIENLKNEGVPDKRMRFVGNIMIDTLEQNREQAASLDINQIVRENLFDSGKSIAQLKDDEYAVMTLHRPSNVDNKEILTQIVNFICGEVTDKLSLVWAIHPRTAKRLNEFGLFEKVIKNKKIILTSPIGYLEMLRLNMNCKIMLTDSGGLQEECTVLGTPCLTLRWNTERPITLREFGGASVLVGNNIERIRKEFNYTLGLKRNPVRPELWDGNTAKRCLDAIMKYEE